MVNDTDDFAFEENGIVTAQGLNDGELRSFLHERVMTNMMTLTLDVKSNLKIFSEFRMKNVCEFYDLGYDPSNPLSQFPVFQCQYENVDNKLLCYLMDELNSRMTLTPAVFAPEAHKSISVYCILHVVAKSFASELKVLAERYVEGSLATGTVDYSVTEVHAGEILRATEAKRDDYILGVAQNDMKIRSTLEYNRKRKRGDCNMVICNDLVLVSQLMHISGIFRNISLMKYLVR